MPIGTSDGSFYKDFFDKQRQERLYVSPMKPPSGDEGMVIDPRKYQMDKELNSQQADDELFGGTEVSYKTPDTGMADRYNTQLTSQEEAEFQQWAKDNPRLGSTYDYDARGFWKAGAGTSDNGHGADTWKKPNHPTFSDQSMYHGVDGYQGGTWGNEGGKTFFSPSETNIKNMSGGRLQEYFQKYEPDVSLRMPLGSPTEPAGALKSPEGSQVPGNVDWTKYNQPFGSIKGTAPEDTPIAFRTPYLDIHEGDIDRAMGIALSSGPNPIQGKFHNYINMFMKQPMPREIADSYKLPPVMTDEDIAKSVAKKIREFDTDNPTLTPGQNYGQYTHKKPEGGLETHVWYGPEGYFKFYPGLNERTNVDFYPNKTTGPAWESMTPKEAVDKMLGKHVYEGDVTVKKMSPEEVQKMKESWGKADINQFKQTPFNPDTWEEEVRALADALDKASKPKSPKEAFIEGAQAIHDKLMTTFANIKSKYIEAIRNPVTTVPNIQKAQERGYTVPAYKGMVVEDFTGAKPVQKFQNYGEMYSTESPLLAEMYAGFVGKTKAPRPTGPVEEGEFATGAQIVPLLINTKDYHTYDGGGKGWQSVNEKAIQEARKLKKPGVIIQNVWDEPSSTTHLGSPKTVYITLPSGAHTVKSRFAKDFDPSSPNMLHMIPAIGIGGAAGYVAMQPSEQ